MASRERHVRNQHQIYGKCHHISLLCYIVLLRAAETFTLYTGSSYQLSTMKMLQRAAKFKRRPFPNHEYMVLGHL